MFNGDKLVKQKKEFSANLNELKREPPNEFGHMLLKYNNLIIFVNL